MATPEEAVQAERTKHTRLLLIGGAASLTLPLLGVVYLRMSEAKTSRPPDASVTFDRREKGGEKMISLSETITVNSQTPSMPASQSPMPIGGAASAVAAPAGGSSLDFVKRGENNAYFQDKPATPAAAAASTAPAAATAATAATAAATPPAPEPGKTAAAKKGGKKPFMMPKLNGTKALQGSGFKSGSQKGAPGAGGDGKGGADMAEMLKKVPGAGSNPELQKYLNKSK